MSNWDTAFIQRYNVQGPRYTSYPPATSFHEEVTTEQYQQALAAGNADRRRLSLYMHIPFCEHVCFYCACTRIVTADHRRASEYLRFLLDEISLKGALVDKQRPVTQMHWGGGTPTYLSDAEMTELVYHTARHFHLLEDGRGDYSIEIDPRTVTEKRVSLLRGLGFNRASLGVQDLDPHVQKAINRIQPYEQIRDVFGWLTDQGFKSINTDLIYGLPWQSEASLARTVEKLLELRPHRISLFNYAHLPERFKTQRQINELALPAADEKLKMLARAGSLFEQAGYVLIGMDHFALPDDELTLAQQDGTLQRNFQGYSVQNDADLIGFGMSSISQLGNFYGQSYKSIQQWQAALADNAMPLERGFLLSREDEIRRDLIMSLLCNLEIQWDAFNARWGVDGRSWFAEELAFLSPFERDELLVSDEQGIRVNEKGRLVVRVIAMTFDSYLSSSRTHNRFSRIL